jgi:hypothetical protein
VKIKIMNMSGLAGPDEGFHLDFGPGYFSGSSPLKSSCEELPLRTDSMEDPREEST